MSDTYGGTTIPIQKSTNGEDVVLYYTGAFLQAVSNKYTVVEWQNLKPGPLGPLPVRSVLGFDPKTMPFNESDLPAIFIFKPDQTERRIVQVAEDIRVEEGPLHIQWVPAPSIQIDRARQSTFGWKLMKVWDDMVDIGRDPSFMVAGDEYPSAQAVQYSGSMLSQFAPVRRLWMETLSAPKLVIRVGTAVRTYDSFLAKATLEEQLIGDPYARYKPMGGLKQTTTTDPSDPLGPQVTSTMQLP